MEMWTQTDECPPDVGMDDTFDDCYEDDGTRRWPSRGNDQGIARRAWGGAHND